MGPIFCMYESSRSGSTTTMQHLQYVESRLSRENNPFQNAPANLWPFDGKKALCCQVTVLCESFDILQCIQWCHDQGYDPEQKTNKRNQHHRRVPIGPWSPAVIQPTKLMTRLNDRCHVNGQEVCIHVNAAVVIYQRISLVRIAKLQFRKMVSTCHTLLMGFWRPSSGW